jgi:hypothetical protein
MNKQKVFSSFKDENDVVRILNHHHTPIHKETKDVLQLAKEYILEVADQYNISKEMLEHLDSRPESLITEEGESYKILTVKKMRDTTIVDYAQTYFGLPVWHSGLTVVIKNEPMQVVSSSNSSQIRIKVNRPKVNHTGNGISSSPYSLHTGLGLAFNREKESDLKISQSRMMIYKYEAAKRFTDHSKNEIEKIKQVGFIEKHFTQPFPQVRNSVKEGELYVVNEILFSYSLPNIKKLNWRSIVEVESGSVLYLRALADNLLSEQTPSPYIVG